MQSVLIVDDAADRIERMLAGHLENVDILGATSLRQARESLQVRFVDALVVEEQLRDGRGLDLLAELAQTMPDVPAILLASEPGRELLQAAARQRQVVAVMPKPVEEEPLADLVRRELAKWGGSRGRIPPVR